jgi:hypothetical protein
MSNRSSLTPIYPASLTDYLKSHYVGLRDGTGIVIGWVGKSCTIELWSDGKLSGHAWRGREVKSSPSYPLRNTLRSPFGQGVLEWRLSWPKSLMKSCCIAA